MVFIDADAFIGLHVNSDVHHPEALAIMAKISDTLVTSTDVIDEVTTKLSLFTTHQKAIDFLTDILSSQVQIEYLTPARLRSAADLFRRQTSKHVSLTDCVNIVICLQLGIKQIFSFDRHYPQNSLHLFK